MELCYLLGKLHSTDYWTVSYFQMTVCSKSGNDIQAVIATPARVEKMAEEESSVVCGTTRSELKE